MGVARYCENAHLLRPISEHTCTSTIYYQVDLVIKGLHCKAKYSMNLKVDLALLNTGDLMLLLNLQSHGLWHVHWKIGHFHCNILHTVINRTEFCECSLLAGPYYLAQNMLSCKENAAVTNGLFITYYV